MTPGSTTPVTQDRPSEAAAGDDINDAAPTPAPPAFCIAGVGASAGGLEALERLFRATPLETRIAYIVIQHLSPDFKSVMDELLRRQTRLPIHRIEDGMELQPDHIYLLPPRKEVIISGGKLHLADKDPHQDVLLPIDHFLRSLAHEAGRKAIAIILSGTGSDGSRGIREIHEAGGFVVVQKPETAKFDGMPRSAIDTGIADAQLAPEEIPNALVSHVTGVSHDPGIAQEEHDPADAGMDAIFRLLLEEHGIDFSHYKSNTVGRRVSRRLTFNRLQNVAEYAELLKSNPDELNALYKDLLIGVTRFFRDTEAFDELEKILPEILAKKRSGDELRVWIAGCATGEEAYSIAIQIHEQMKRVGHLLSVKLFATDVHETSLETAAAGVYSAEAVADVSPTRLANYFSRDGDAYHVRPELRQMIVFARHNLVKDAPFTKIDLITCRNVLIYFQPALQKKILSLFHFGLRSGGHMFLGPSESLGDLTDEFEVINEHCKIYRKRRDVRLAADLRLPTPAARQPMRIFGAGDTHGDSTLLYAYDRLLEQHMPPGFLVSERRQLVHAFGGAGKFLRHPDGRVSSDLLELVDPNLKVAIAGLMQRANKDHQPHAYTHLRFQNGTDEAVYDLSVKPILNRQNNVAYYFISFEPQAPAPPAAGQRLPLNMEEAARERITSIEGELHRTRENLQATVEELETSNEELQSSNEELVSSNEELQSTNEELHSVNEELYTVNAEYQKKIEELTELGEDMENLFRSTDVAVLFVDRNLCIRKFTPQIGKLLDLMPQDVGRRIDSFSHHLADVDLLDLVRQTMATGKPFEQQVRDKAGTWYYLRILPYRSNTKSAGVVLTLFDIAQLKKAEEEARDGVRRRDLFLAMLSHELRNPLAAILNASRLLQDAPDAEDMELSRGIIQRQARHMGRLLDDLLDVSRITRDKIEIRRQAVDLRTVTRDALEAIRPFADARGIELHIDLPPGPVVVNGDPARLQQIEVNLLNNAVRYTPSRGQVWLSLKSEHGTACLTVRDTGAGIPRDMHDKIFDLFVQLERDTGSAAGGMGVGLTLVRALVQLHGGKVTVGSEGEGKGSEFQVTLPTIDPRLPEPPPNISRQSLAGLRALVVEDNHDIRRVTQRLLKGMGVDVTTAEDGARGLEALLARQFDIALIDIGLPEMDGYEVARQARRAKSPEHLKLVAVTGFGQLDDRERALQAGFDDHLVKPVDLEQLYEMLCRLTGRESD